MRKDLQHVMSGKQLEYQIKTHAIVQISKKKDSHEQGETTYISPKLNRQIFRPDGLSKTSLAAEAP